MRPGLLGQPLNASFTLSIRPSTMSLVAFASSTRNASSSSPRARPRRSTSPALTERVPPESPRYVNYPTPPQAEDIRKPPRRGHLPVPRDVFHVPMTSARKKADPAKTAPKTDPAAFTAKVAPISQSEARGEAPWSELVAYRRRMADRRRTSLAEGLEGLLSRQQQRKQRERTRQDNVANRNRRAALFKPEGRDDVLSRSSVLASTAQMTAVIRDPLRHEKQAASAVRTAAVVQAKHEARRDALMDLYHEAGKFIVDEQELEQRVSELFSPDYFRMEGYSHGTIHAENIWDVVGKPSSLQDMMNSILRTETKLFDSKRTELDRTTTRQKQVAEALTGGKMPV